MRHPATTLKLAAGLALTMLCTANCASVLGPSCLAQQKTGTVTAVSGEVGAGATVFHVVPYEVQGSQNNISVSWSGQGQLTGPRLYFYATSTACVNFTAPPTDGSRSPNTGDCQSIGSPGGTLAPYARDCVKNSSCAPHAGDIVQRSTTVTGPGNGQPAGFREYKIWVVGDATLGSTAYSISITYFSGPDC